MSDSDTPSIPASHNGGHAPMNEPRRLNRVSTQDALVEEIKRDVLNGSFAAGSPLREIDLAQQFGVGRQSTRSALQALVHMGLLRHEPNRGVFVPVFTENDLRDLFVVRTAFESEAAHRAARDGADLAAVDAAVAALRSLPANAPRGEALARDLAFHAALVGTLHSQRAAQMFTALQLEWQLIILQFLVPYSDIPTLVQEHQAIVDAIRTGDPERAAGAVRRHLENSMEAVRPVDVVAATPA